MYEGWKITRWETPVVDVNELLMVSLVDMHRELTIVFESFRDPNRPRWRARFQQYPAYRNIEEAYRTDLWGWLDDSGQRVGQTFTVEESSPLASWGTVYLHLSMPKIRHFVITTMDDVLEILSPEEPIWEAIRPAEKDEPLPGKATHFFLGEDDEAIGEMVEDLRRRKKPKDAD